MLRLSSFNKSLLLLNNKAIAYEFYGWLMALNTDVRCLTGFGLLNWKSNGWLRQNGLFCPSCMSVELTANSYFAQFSHNTLYYRQTGERKTDSHRRHTVGLHTLPWQYTLRDWMLFSAQTPGGGTWNVSNGRRLRRECSLPVTENPHIVMLSMMLSVHYCTRKNRLAFSIGIQGPPWPPIINPWIRGYATEPNRSYRPVGIR